MNEFLKIFADKKKYGTDFILIGFYFLLLSLVYFVCQLCIIGIIKFCLQIINRTMFFKGSIDYVNEKIKKNENLFPFSLLKSRFFFILLSIPLIAHFYSLLPTSTFSLEIKRLVQLSTFITWLFIFLTSVVTLPFEQSSRMVFHSSLFMSFVISIVIYINYCI